MDKGGEEEVFEIDDFTVITELERFVVAIEALVQDWGLIGERQLWKYPKGTLRTCRWKSKSAVVNFGVSNKLKVAYYQPDIAHDVIEAITISGHSERATYLPSFASDISNSETDFVYHSNITTMARSSFMYGVSEFILFSPSDQVDDTIVTEDQKNLVISAFRIAQHIPMFIQFEHIDRQLFFGTSCNKSVVAHYEKIRGKRETIFKLRVRICEKDSCGICISVKCPISLLDADDIRVSVQFDYSVKFSPYETDEMDQSCETIECYSLPFGSRDEPVSEFILTASWPNMKEEMINENEYHSDLDLLSAFNWAGSLIFRHSEGLLKVFGNLTDGGIQNIRFAGVPNLSITNPGGIAFDESAIQSMIDRCMDEVFDILDNKAETTSIRMRNQHLVGGPGSAIRTSTILPSRNDVNMGAYGAQFDDWNDFGENALLRQNKWTPRGSLTCRFANAFLSASFDSVFGPHAFAQVWLEFVRRLRIYYDTTEDLPGLGEVSQPNLSHCLFHQKMEMLQCCISAKRKRHELYDSTKDFGIDLYRYVLYEFFDAHSGHSDAESTNDVDVIEDLALESTMNEEPSGRLHPFGEMRLLKHDDTLLYVPITQDRSPMTEDMVEDYARYLSSLDDGEARVQAQLDVLRSDMQAFKFKVDII
ncbi:hypothetical protein DICVIV_10440 [Dictyocaulus viviparus]|uniref:Rab3 GTPase-activating protein catalytic subunit n=1 Tax=Dictyocaulus viviparus TaxID=29172 RepID=A0A0D8XIC4_DICVI|nr:hypothetical protein DICVIV_10440 [Dictyocaulus viviparus]